MKKLIIAFILLLSLSLPAQTIQFDDYTHRCQSSDTFSLDSYVNLKNGKWELLTFNSKGPGTSEYNNANVKLVDSANLIGDVQGAYYFKYSNRDSYNNLIEDSVNFTIGLNPNLSSIRDPIPKCFDNGKFNLNAPYPIGCNVPQSIFYSHKITYRMLDRRRKNMIDENNSVNPHWYFTDSFYNSSLNQGYVPDPNVDPVEITIKEQATGCTDKVTFNVRINPTPLVITEDITRCQDAGSFRLNDYMLISPPSPDAGTYTWEIDSAPKSLNPSEYGQVLEDRGLAPSFSDYWFNPMNPFFPIDHPEAVKRLGCYKLKFCFTDKLANCKTCEFAYVCVESFPEVQFKPFDKFCYSDDTICLDSYVNLNDGRWELKTFNGVTSGAAFNAALEKMIDSTKIVVKDPTGAGGTYTWRYVNVSTGCPLKDSINMIVSNRPPFQVRNLDTICEFQDSINLLNNLITPDKSVFLKGANGTAWSGKGVEVNKFSPADVIPPFFGENYFSTFVYSTYVNPNTECKNEDSALVTIERSLKLNTGVYRINNYFYSNDPTTSYQWVTCPDFTAIPNENQRKFTPSQNGSYAVIISKGNCNVDTSGCVNMNNVGLSSIEEPGFQIVPNPIQSTFQIQSSNKDDEITEILALDILGKVIKNIKNPKMLGSVPFNYPKGIYFIRIQTNGSSYVFRVIKQ